jgi:hypothetical protein
MEVAVTLRNQVGIALVLVLVGYFTGRYATPPTVVTKVETKVVEVIKKDVKTIVKETRKPDGTVVTTTKTHDKSVDKRTDTQTAIVAKKSPDWIFGVSTTFTNTQVYGVEINRRVLGPLFIGVMADTSGNSAAKLLIEF